MTQRVSPRSTCAAAPAAASSSTSATCRRPGAERDRILLAALGSPDPYGRQLDGLGGGISSLSKACIIGPPTHPDARRGLHLRAGRGRAGPWSTTPATAATARRRWGPSPSTRASCPPARRRDRRAHPQHQHEEDHRRPRAGGGRRGGGGGRLRAARRGRPRRAHRARLRRARAARGTGRLLPTGRPRDDHRRARAPRWWTPPTRWSSSAPRTSGSPAPRSPQAMDGDRALVARLERHPRAPRPR